MARKTTAAKPTDETKADASANAVVTPMGQNVAPTERGPKVTDLGNGTTKVDY